MKEFNVIIFDFNSNKFVAYNVIPYFVNKYNDRVKANKEANDALKNAVQRGDEHEIENATSLLKSVWYKIPESFEEFKDFVKNESQYQFWARCEYEIILEDWPCQKTSEKWDVHRQVMMNLDTVTNIVIAAVNDSKQ